MLNIPEDKLPIEFKDETRLDSLYSPLRTRTVNPRDWNSKIHSWRQIITLYCTNNALYTFTLSTLSNIFVRNGRPPSCIGVVVEDLVKSGDLVALDEFLKKSSKTWSGWATDMLVKKPISWSYNTLKRSLFMERLNSETVYVHRVVVEDEAQKLWSCVPDKHRNKAFSLDEFLAIIDRTHQRDSVKLLLHCLEKENRAAVASLDDNTLLVKIGDEKGAIPISEIDIGVHVLEKNETLFTKQVEELEDDIAVCLKTVKSHLMKGHRQLAKTCLKKKHEMEKRLFRKLDALHNVQTLLERIQDVHTDNEVWKSYKQALATFNTTFKETGLNEDSVEDTMLQLGEMLEIHKDIEHAVSKPLTTEDDGDLEAELAELLKSDETNDSGKGDGGIQEQMAKLDIGDLPDLSFSDASDEPVALK